MGTWGEEFLEEEIKRWRRIEETESEEAKEPRDKEEPSPSHKRKGKKKKKKSVKAEYNSTANDMGTH